MLPALTGSLLVSRITAILTGFAALIFAYRWFSFAERGISKRKAAKAERRAKRLSAILPEVTGYLPGGDVASSSWTLLVERTRFEARQVFKSPGFIILMLVGLFMVGLNLLLAVLSGMNGTPIFPVTFAIMELLIGSFSLFPMIIAVYYSGELVWRDRDIKMHEIIDSTPIPNWAYMVPKTIAVSGVLFAALVISVGGAILIQLSQGFGDISWGQYLLWYVLPQAADMVILAALAVFVQALVPNKYIGWGIMLLYLIAIITLSNIGFEHPLYLYGSTGGTAFSDLNADNANAGGWWLRLYWGAFAVMLAVLAHFLWRRGTEVSLKPRLRQIPRRMFSSAGAVMGLAALVAAGTGGYIFYNMNILNDYVTQEDTDKTLAAYEKKYLKYETLKQPSVTAVKFNIDIYPETQTMKAAGTVDIVNDTGAPVETLHVLFGDRFVKVDAIDIPASKLEMEDEEMKYRIYRLNAPMQLGEKRTFTFRTSREQRGFRADNNDTRLVQNGTFLNNSEFAPMLGMSRSGLLSDRVKRRKYGLPAELRPPKLEDESAREKNYVGNADWVMSDITVSTSKGQTPIAPGKKMFDDVKRDRRIARFVSINPILHFFSVQSANYAVKERKANGIDMAVYYDPRHDYNVDTMLDATQTSIAYYRKNFGPYQFDYARIIEFPGYAAFAQAFAGTIPYSESIGFIADNSDPDAIDYVTYVTAHEFGHQYWAHQLISSDQQGSTMLIETMAQYSALMVMKQIYGEDKIRRFLKYELDNYLSARGSEAIEELPLNRVEDQGYIHYRKGAVVMYLLQDRLGEDRVNAMLAKLLDKYRFKSQPYSNANDLVDGFKSLARNDGERQLVSDLLEKITVYDLKADEAKVRKLADGKFETILIVKADKFYADGQGKETKAKLSDTIEIGLFAAKPGIGAFGKKDVISMERKPVKSGKQTIRIISSKKPEFVGVDPYNKYIDRNSDDNVIAVTAG